MTEEGLTERPMLDAAKEPAPRRVITPCTADERKVQAVEAREPGSQSMQGEAAPSVIQEEVEAPQVEEPAVQQAPDAEVTDEGHSSEEKVVEF